MAARRCMNAACGKAAQGEWRKGWALRSGGFAILCEKCGLAYDQLVFCDMFHQNESGWRECSSCAKRLHCGCIASELSFDLLDCGGVQCMNCMKNMGVQYIFGQVNPKFLANQNHQGFFGVSGFSPNCEKTTDGQLELPFSADCSTDEAGLAKSSTPFHASFEAGQSSVIAKLNKVDNRIALFHGKQDNLHNRDTNRILPSVQVFREDDTKDATPDGTKYDLMEEDGLNMSLGVVSIVGKSDATAPMDRHAFLSSSVGDGDGNELSSPISLQHMQRGSCVMIKPPKFVHDAAYDMAKEVPLHMRMARTPAEGRGRNQLLPRYWPRITDQELRQISGEVNATIVPLFEKVLSASDAGRIGRLVLPKACAEAYFPPISQPEGRPLTIQDAKGKEWHFQFRFWPNNNSRMYVLEGVTPCIQSLQLQAGDTVTFSRIEPRGKLVMGYRKATNTGTLQDAQISAIANGSLVGDAYFNNPNENLAIVSGTCGNFPLVARGPTDFLLGSPSEQVNSADEDVSWLQADKVGGMPNMSYLEPSQRRSRNIGSRSRKFHIDAEEAFQLKLTWEEAQDLLRPPPNAKPSIVLVEDCEFEEYEEPPVFGKRTIFTQCSSGEQEQWIQCDECFKWRRLPVYAVVSSRWKCSDISWDPKILSSCTAPEELTPKELQHLLQQYEEIRRRRIIGSFKHSSSEGDTPGLEALANAAVLGDAGNQAAPVATTTKHPRHRAGCTCIVCIQPPSGKGPKHNPSCTCNVCMTVKRRFRTLMMRKKQRQSERDEAEANKKMQWCGDKEEAEGSNSSRGQLTDPNRESDVGSEKLEAAKGLDLNFHPVTNEEPPQQQAGQYPMSMVSLLQAAARPLETYLKENGLMTLACKQGSSSMVSAGQQPMESDEKTSNEGRVSSADREMESCVDEGADNLETAGNDGS